MTEPTPEPEKKPGPLDGVDDLVDFVYILWRDLSWPQVILLSAMIAGLVLIFGFAGG